VFSFYANKTLATGEGGMVVTADPAVAARCRVMRLHGIDRDAFDRFRSERPAWYYEIVAPGFKYNLPDLAAAVGIHQLRRVRAMQQRRDDIASRYDAALADLPVLCPPRPPAGETHAWHLYVLRLSDGAASRDTVIGRLAAEGIGTSVHYIPLHLQPYWRDRYHLSATHFPVSQHVFDHALSLPIYSRMTDADVDRVIAAVRRAVCP
jgi:dTDP-4-amino-4,6-dideoxygalactose transaminase